MPDVDWDVEAMLMRLWDAQKIDPTRIIITEDVIQHRKKLISELRRRELKAFQKRKKAARQRTGRRR
jgi:hypothetical protein